jgi:SPX domain protein involved in polyphosphate accumulation
MAKIQSRLSDFMRLDKHNRQGEPYRIINLYYDTDDNALIRNSLAKPAYKEKLRLRAYGTPDSESTVYAEIKKKVNGAVNKRRSAMKPAEAYDFLASGTLPECKPYMNRQVMAEIAYFLECNDVKPALYLAYERIAYFDAAEQDLRVSFDTEIRARRSDLRLESGAYGEALLGEGECLMEIKTSRSIPIRLCRLLSEYEIYPRPFSKYGYAYMQYTRLRKEGSLSV